MHRGILQVLGMEVGVVVVVVDSSLSFIFQRQLRGSTAIQLNEVYYDKLQQTWGSQTIMAYHTIKNNHKYQQEMLPVPFVVVLLSTADVIVVFIGVGVIPHIFDSVELPYLSFGLLGLQIAAFCCSVNDDNGKVVLFELMLLIL